jgi:hypothetical protein
VPGRRTQEGGLILFLTALRARVELVSRSGGSQCLKVTFGEDPGLSASELVMGYEAGKKAEAKGDEEAQQAARRSFLIALEEEITAYQKLQALYREGGDRDPGGDPGRADAARCCLMRKTSTTCCGRRECWNWNTNSGSSSGWRGGGLNREIPTGDPKEERVTRFPHF